MYSTDPIVPPDMNCYSSSVFLEEIWYIASPKAMKVKKRIKRKNLMSFITSMMILIKYPVD